MRAADAGKQTRNQEYRDHDDLALIFSIQHNLREFFDKRSAHILVDNRVHSRIAGDSLEHFSNAYDEIDSKARCFCSYQSAAASNSFFASGSSRIGRVIVGVA